MVGRHLMIIGGSGMLRGVALEFAQRGWTVSVVGRRPAPLQQLADEPAPLPGRIIPLAADYTNSGSIAARLRERCDEHGAPAVAVAWIHVTAPDAPIVCARSLVAASDGAPLEFLHVLTRLRTPDPRDRSVAIPSPHEAALHSIPGVTYRRAVLGWIVEPAGSRWLTHEEIAGGVIGAIDSDATVTSIGQTDPIESSPHYAGP